MSRSIMSFALMASLAPVSLAAETAAAPGAECARIADVQVPYEVEVGDSSLAFTNRHDRVVVTEASIHSPAGDFSDAAVKDHYRALRGFLDQSGSMAKVARSFFNRSAFPQAATSMCKAILEVHATGADMERRFPGYRSPVRIELE